MKPKCLLTSNTYLTELVDQVIHLRGRRSAVCRWLAVCRDTVVVRVIWLLCIISVLLLLLELALCGQSRGEELSWWAPGIVASVRCGIRRAIVRLSLSWGILTSLSLGLWRRRR